ncbi:hypothetical protein [Prosthecomicrobium sp. N25]|uniref:hypothetical protein n=1 Tax=Prosthecomicrobium sp. N25 TaxID=3129254 RepID=UPI003077647B
MSERSIARRLLSALLLAGSVWLSGPSPARAMEYRDNTVEMPVSASGYRNVSATYTVEDFKITSGQDPQQKIKVGLQRTYSSSDDKMTYSIGRHGSSEVADWFKTRVPASRTTFGHDPGHLNFAFLGKLEITLTGGVLGPNKDTYVLADIAIAQGHVAFRNNWWFGGKACTHIGSDKVRCPGTSTAGYTVNFVFHRGGNGVNKIDLTAVEYPGYELFSLDSKYKNENTSCSWQPSAAPCPPFVVYYDGTEASSLRLSVKNGVLYTAVGTPFDTTYADDAGHKGVAIFVMDKGGAIYASNRSVTFLFHHSTILAGAPVASAGLLVAKAGVVSDMSNCSGHYKPPTVAYRQLMESLHRQGYQTSVQFHPCKSHDERWVPPQGIVGTPADQPKSP